MPARDQPALSAEFEALYHEHFAFVWRTLRRLGVPEATIDDATQDVFVVAHRRFGVWEQRASARVWLHGVAKRVASKHRRGHDRHERKVAALPIPEGPRMLDEHVADRARLERIAAAIDRLEPERREVYVLAELEGLSAPEIAELLDCKLNTVYSRLRRARADLDAALAERGLHDSPPTRALASGTRQRNHDGRTR
ncbi:RNA polymerase sigma factor [Nannocystaceae bacterium ST9]